MRQLSLLILLLLSAQFVTAQYNGQRLGIKDRTAPEWDVPYWLDERGRETAPIQVTDFDGKVRVIFTFQSWCPGCHSTGFPTLQKLVKHFEGQDEVVFLSIQTAFEGERTNNKSKLKKLQKKYKLNIPFGQDQSSVNTANDPSVLYLYRTGGTPWFIVIDKEGKVVYNDFQIHSRRAIDLVEGLLKE